MAATVSVDDKGGGKNYHISVTALHDEAGRQRIEREREREKKKEAWTCLVGAMFIRWRGHLIYRRKQLTRVAERCGSHMMNTDESRIRITQ